MDFKDRLQDFVDSLPGYDIKSRAQDLVEPDLDDTKPNKKLLGDNGLATEVTRDKLNIVSRSSAYTELGSAISNTFKGINLGGSIPGLPINKDMYGLTLFTRPNMNLSSVNLSSNRKLASMSSDMINSMGRIIRCYLDPEAHKNGLIESDLVNPKSPWINLLSNTLETISGFPDITLDTYKAPPGIHRETWLMYDGVATTHHEYSLTASFRNIIGDPVSFLFDMWLTYGHCVRQGIVTPYLSNIVDRRIDYQTAIWRIVLNENRTHITKIACTYASVPVNWAAGSAFNYNTQDPLNLNTQTINIQFDTVGACYNDPILYDEFNRLVIYYNPAMSPTVRERQYVKLTMGETLLSNYMEVYLWINKDTLELERWMPKSQYNRIFRDGSL